MDSNHGTIRIKLDEETGRKGISKNRIAFLAHLQRSRLNKYSQGK